MANITLRSYLDEVQGLLQAQALEEVIGHCRHILQHFSKNIETYRLLGQALLEKSRYQETIDVFHRVLSAVPDDFIAHVGLSSAWEEQGQFANALHHLERAAEQDPNNPTLQSEIKRLYERNELPVPERLYMSRGALARMYFKGKLYDQAILELQNNLRQDASRVDLLLLYAQTLEKVDRPVEAADVALSVLEKLPECLDANRIVASLWLSSKRPSDAKPFIEQLEQLDPYVAWTVIHPDGKALPRDAFNLSKLVWDAKAAARMTADTPDWVSSLHDVFDDPSAISLMESKNLGTEARDITPVPGGTGLLKKTGSLDPATVAPEPDDMPDWFREIAANSAEKRKGDTDELPDWTTEDNSGTQIEVATSTPAEDLSALLFNDEEDDPFGPSRTGASDALAADWLNLDDIEHNTPVPSTNFEDHAALDSLSWLSDDIDDADATETLLTPDAVLNAPLSADGLASTEAAAEPASTEPVDPNDPLAWMKAAGLEPLDKPEKLGTMDFLPEGELDTSVEVTSADPLAWMRSAGLEPSDALADPASSLPTINGADSADEFDFFSTESAPTNTVTDEAAGEDPFAWMQAAGLEPSDALTASASSLPTINGADSADEFDFFSTEVASTDAVTDEAAGEDPFAWMQAAGLEPSDALTASASNLPAADSADSADEFDFFSTESALTDNATDNAAGEDPLAWMQAAGFEPYDTANQSDPLFEPLSSDADDFDILEAASPLSPVTTIDRVDGEMLVSADVEGLPPDEGNLKLPDWLIEAVGSTPHAQEPAELVADEEVIHSDIPAWMQDLAPSVDASTAPASGVSTSLDELDFGALDNLVDPNAVIDDDWLKSSVPASVGDLSADLDSLFSDHTEQTAQPVNMDSDHSDDWLSGLDAVTSAPLSSVNEADIDALFAGQSDEVAQPASVDNASGDDWLTGLDAVTSTPLSSVNEADIDALFAEQSDEVAQPASVDNASGDDWLAGLDAVTSTPLSSVNEADIDALFAGQSDEVAQPTNVDSDSGDDWLAELDAVSSTPSSSVNEADIDALFAGQSDEVAQPTNVDSDSGDDWLAELDAVSSTPLSSVNEADIDALFAGQSDEVAQPTSMDSDSSDDWLAGLDTVASTSPTSTTDSEFDALFAGSDVATTDDWFNASASETRATVEIVPDETPSWLLEPTLPNETATSSPTSEPSLDTLASTEMGDLDWMTAFTDPQPPAITEATTIDSTSQTETKLSDTSVEHGDIMDTHTPSESDSFVFKKAPSWMRKKNKPSQDS